MGKVIIDNRTRLVDADALYLVIKVMDEGRVSNYGKQYCYHTVFDDEHHVSSFLNKSSDRFVVHYNGEDHETI